MSTPREILNQADRLHRTSRAAEDLRVAIRLGRKPRLRRGILAWTGARKEHTLTTDETNAVYDALADVRDRMGREARALEESVAVASEAAE